MMPDHSEMLATLIRLSDVDDEERISALNRLVEQSYKTLRRIARHLIDQADGPISIESADLVGQLFDRLASRPVDWRNPGEFAFVSFARTTMKRMLIDHLRSRTRRRRFFTAAELEQTPDFSQGEPIQSDLDVEERESHRREMTRLARQFAAAMKDLESLHPEWHRCLKAGFQESGENRTFQELGRLLDIPASTAHYRFARAIDFLRDHVASREKSLHEQKHDP